MHLCHYLLINFLSSLSAVFILNAFMPLSSGTAISSCQMEVQMSVEAQLSSLSLLLEIIYSGRFFAVGNKLAVCTTNP